MKPALNTNNRELEAKFAISKGDFPNIDSSLKDLMEHGQLMIAGTRVLEFTDYYYDTPDQLLAFNNCSLRLRERQGHPTKLTFKKFISSSEEGIQLRMELEGIPTKQLITNVLEEAPWLAVRQQHSKSNPVGGHIELMHNIGVFSTFRIVNERKIHTIVTQDELYAEVSIDKGYFRKDDIKKPLFEFEIEYLSGDDSRMAAFCNMVTSEIGKLKHQKRSKYIRGLKELKMWKDRKGAKGKRFKRWRKELNRLFKKFHSNFTEAINFNDPEALHKTRVSIRRITTLLNFLPDFNDSAASGAFVNSRLSEIQDRLGIIRDYDVLLVNTKSRGDKVPVGVFELIKVEREASVLKALREFGTLNTRKLKKRWTKFLDSELKSALSKAKVEQHYINLKSRLKRSADDFNESRKIRGGTHPISIKKLHRSRIILKELRYASQLIGMLSPGSPKIDTASYVQLQDILGNINDRHNEISFYNHVLEVYGDILNPGVGDLLGQLRGDFERNIEQLDLISAIPWKVVPYGGHDLTEVKGVGTKTKQILLNAGIRNIDDLAQMEEEQLLQQIELSPHLVNRALKEDWIGQARKLAL